MRNKDSSGKRDNNVRNKDNPGERDNSIRPHKDSQVGDVCTHKDVTDIFVVLNYSFTEQKRKTKRMVDGKVMEGKMKQEVPKPQRERESSE